LTWQSRFLALVNRNGESVTLTVTTGTVCPCMSYKGRDSYSEEWHRLNPSEDDCGSTGLIDTTNTATTMKAILYFPQDIGNTPEAKAFLESIGEIANTDLFALGNVKTSDLSFVDLRDYTEYDAKITYDSNNYSLRDVKNLPKDAGQWSRWVRRG